MTIDKEKLKALAERAVDDYPLFDHSMAYAAPAVMTLLVEIERLEELASSDRDRVMAVIGQYANIEAERDQLKAENEALRKDAERYRWLRLGMGKAIVVVPDNDRSCDCELFEVLLESEVDQSVDAAMSKEATHG